MDLTCVNCKEPTSSDEAKFFAQVFVCPSCFAIAERLYEKGSSELKMMLVMLKECIRLAIIKGELQFPEQNLEDMPRKDLFSELAKLAQNARLDALKNEPTQDELAAWKKTQASSTPTTTPLLESTKPSAAGETAPGKPSSDSTSQ